MTTAVQYSEKMIMDLLSEIPDPEVPAISIVDLGVVRSVDVNLIPVLIKITPTYSGCPALKMMEESIYDKMKEAGIEVKVETVFKPAWTTDWMSDATKEKLRAYGIAPPQKLTFEHLHPFSKLNHAALQCPFCSSTSTTLTSQFGSTACKALYYCNGCHQPFEHFKCH